jgi:methylglyoxal/glyoxal reductase
MGNYPMTGELKGPQTTVELRGGVPIPVLGLGVFRAPAGGQTAAAVQAALREGYRHIDAAGIYRNEADVGADLRASGLDRERVFVTTKIWNGDHGYPSTLDAVEASRRRFGVHVVDHSPVVRGAEAGTVAP